MNISASAAAAEARGHIHCLHINKLLLTSARES